MKAMILAAGLGTRLGEITRRTPKCLVEAGGKTLLEHTILRLGRAGVTEIVVNLHHLAGEVDKFLDGKSFPGITIHRSREPEILETGGGVKAAHQLLQQRGSDLGDGSPKALDFFVHNADVYTTLDLNILSEVKTKANADAVLLVADQKTSGRGLLVDDDYRLCGWQMKESRRVVREVRNLRLVNFCGIQLCSQAVFEWMEPLGAYFSIIEAYLEGVRRGAEVIVTEGAADKSWFDVGTPERLEALRSFLSPPASMPPE